MIIFYLKMDVFLIAVNAKRVYSCVLDVAQNRSVMASGLPMHFGLRSSCENFIVTFFKCTYSSFFLIFLPIPLRHLMPIPLLSINDNI